MIARVALALAGLLLAREARLAFVTRRAKRRRVYAEAMAHARAAGVPLLVVGDPDTGFVTRFFGRDYGCGDVCTDITGCPRCPVGLKGSLEEVLARLPARSHVIAVEYTLEYVPKLPEAVREIERVAIPGGIHVGHLEPGSLTSQLWFGGKWVVESAPPGPWRYRRLGEPALARGQ
jgi:hypothetical protein